MDPGILERMRLVVRALTSAGIPYAFGGAIALSFHIEPRATRDLDVNIFLPESEARRVLVVLEAAGVPVNMEDARSIERDGQTRLPWGEYPLDLFFAVIPFLELCDLRAREVPWQGETIRILSAEDLAVCKMLFDRPKDWLDLREMLLVHEYNFDVEYVADWVGEIAGRDDSRIARLYALVKEVWRVTE